jgi:hypothetical protein
VVILIVRDKNLQKINGENGYLLRKTSKACNVTITRESFYPEGSDYYPWGTIDMKIAPGTYAQALWEAKLVKDKISLSEPTAEDKAWVQEQIAKAKKAPEVKPPPKESKPISKQDALAAIEKLPVPRAVGECIQLIGRAGTILSQARVRTARTDTLQNVQHACVNSHFAEARKAVQALVREAITGNKNIEDNKRQPSKTEPKKLTKQEALALIDRSPVPTDPRQCMFTAVRSMRMLVELQAVNSQSEKTMREIRKDCAEGRFADAFKKTKDEVHRALK